MKANIKDNALIRGWKKTRQHWLPALLMDGVFLLLVFWGITQWQARNLLPASSEETAPDFQLTALDGQSYRLSDAAGKQTLLYFFAPWCGVCHSSIDNIEEIRASKSEDELAIFVVALDWREEAEIDRFMQRHDLTVPVLLGGPEELRAFRVAAFPTYYVLDEEGRVTGRSVGYSTELGMRFRL